MVTNKEEEAINTVEAEATTHPDREILQPKEAIKVVEDIPLLSVKIKILDTINLV